MFAQALLPLNLKRLWLFNLGLCALYLVLAVGLPFIKGSVLEFPNAKPAMFDGTVRPIAYVPNWLNAANMIKTLRYENIATSEFVETPFYDPEVFGNDDSHDKLALLARGTYITPYMGSYRMNWKEFDGSHLGVDIRAPLGTPVLAIANGVVIKSVDVEGADGKYVILRHDGISYNGLPIASYYSSYLHLESTAVIEGSVVTKGQTIGKVGLTGITTTPHLHFQIDKADAPFHAYWPYSFSDLRSLNLDFFEAVNVGLGKENAMKYTVSPLDFVQSLENGTSARINPIPQVQVAAVVPEAPQTYIKAVVITSSVQTNTTTVPTATLAPLNSAPVLPVASSAPPTVTNNGSSAAAVRASQAYIDVPSRASYARAAQYLKDRAVNVLSDEQVFRPTQAMTRREAVLYLAGVFNIEPQSGATSSFADVFSDDPALGYIATLQAKNIIQSGWIFRPNEAITKAELVAMMLRITGDYQSSISQYGSAGPIQQFVNTTSFARAKVQPTKAVTRADAAKMIQLWGTLGRG